MNMLQATREEMANRKWYAVQDAEWLNAQTSRQQAELCTDDPNAGDEVDPALCLVIWHAAQTEQQNALVVAEQSVVLESANGVKLRLTDHPNGHDLVAELQGTDPCGVTTYIDPKVIDDRTPLRLRWGAANSIMVTGARLAQLDTAYVTLTGPHLDHVELRGPVQELVVDEARAGYTLTEVLICLCILACMTAGVTMLGCVYHFVMKFW